MWANSVLKWAEQTLENVDRTTAVTSRKIEEVLVVDKNKDSTLGSKEKPQALISEEEIDKVSKEAINEYYEKTEEERLEEALGHVKDKIDLPKSNNEKSESDDSKPANEEESSKTSTDSSEQTIIPEEIISREMILEKSVLKLYEEIKELRKVHEIISNKYESLNSQSQHSQRFNEESQNVCGI